MKIAYLFGSLNRGGLETLMLDLCRKLKPDNFDAIGIYRKTGVLEEEFHNTSVPFYHLTSGKNKLTYILSLRKLLLKEQITVAHAQQPLDALYAYLATRGTGIKVILTLHGFDFSASKRMMQFVLKRTDLNIYVSNYQKNYYVEKYKLNEKKQAVVYNGIDFSKLEVDKTAVGNLRKELAIDDGTILMAMVGNFNEVRDQISVCRFLNELNKEFQNFHFLFVGKRIDNAPQRYDECVHYCKENGLDSRVSFLGSRSDVPSILSQLDAFIYSTDHDTFGIAVIEAIVAGVPVFVNDWKVMEEVTENGKLATIYKTKDSKDLMKKFMHFVENRAEYKKQALERVKWVKEKYGIEGNIEMLKRVYEKAL